VPAWAQPVKATSSAAFVLSEAGLWQIPPDFFCHEMNRFLADQVIIGG
jgi:hypothetical protein